MRRAHVSAGSACVCVRAGSACVCVCVRARALRPRRDRHSKPTFQKTDREFAAGAWHSHAGACYEPAAPDWCSAGNGGFGFDGGWAAPGDGHPEPYGYEAGEAPDWSSSGCEGGGFGGWAEHSAGQPVPGYAGGEAGQAQWCGVASAAGQAQGYYEGYDGCYDGNYAEGYAEGYAGYSSFAGYEGQGGWAGGEYGDDSGMAPPEEPEEVMQECWVLWVGSLPPRISEEELLESFFVYGPIASVSVKSQQQHGVYSSLGFVNFMDEPAALTAYDSMYDGEIGGQQIKLREPQPKQLLAPRWPLNLCAAVWAVSVSVCVCVCMSQTDRQTDRQIGRHKQTHTHTHTHTHTGPRRAGVG